MARHSLPAEIQHAKGADRVNPGRIPTNIPKSTLPLGDCPPDLTREEAAIWEDIVAASPPDMLTRLDRWMLKLACRLQAYIDRTKTEDIQTTKANLLTSILARFGYSPSDRRRIGTNEPPGGANEFDDF